MQHIRKVESIIFSLLFSSMCTQTLAFHTGIIFGWQLQTTYFVWLGSLLFCTYFSLVQDHFTLYSNSKNIKSEVPTLLYLGLFVLLSIYSLVISVPDSDDMTLMHSALEANFNLPYTVGDTLHNVLSLPQISYLHSLTSYEIFLAFCSKLFELDLLRLYHNYMVVIWVLFFLSVFRNIFEVLNFDGKQNLLGLIFISLLITLEVHNPLGYGVVGLTRFFQAKAILWVTFLPYMYFVATRMLANSKPYRITWLFSLSVVSVAMNNSALFLVPVLIFCAALAKVITFQKVTHREKIKEFFVTMVTCCYPAVISILFVCGFFPQPNDMSTWTVGWETNWYALVGLVLSDGAYGLLTFLICVYSSFFLLQKSNEYKNIFFYLIFISFFIFNPWSAAMWISKVSVGAYWRVAFLFLFPIFFGGLALSFYNNKKFKYARFSGFIAICLGSAFLYGSPDLNYKSRLQIKSLLDYRLPVAEKEFALKFGGLLAGASILTSEEMAFTLSLIQPKARFEMTLYGVTVHLFSNVNQPNEGLRRALAQRVVAFGDVTLPAIDAFKISLPNINAIVIKKTTYQTVEITLAAILDKNWRLEASDDNYVLLRRSD